jgi:hypothetical protein
VPLLVSGDLLGRVERAEVYRERLVDTVRVVGRSTPVVLHEIYETDPEALREAKDAARALWAEARQLYCDGSFTRAALGFAEYGRAVPADPVAALYRSRCDEYARQRPSDWDGVTPLGSK